MTLLILFLWLVSIVCDTAGQIAFKYAAISLHCSKNWRYWFDLLRCYWLWIGIFAYGIGFLFWVAFLSLYPLSKAILLGSANIITVMIVGRILFKEQLTFYRILGAGFIISGIILVGLG